VSETGLSVVLASMRARPVATAALDALYPQCLAARAELVVARRPTGPEERWLAARYPDLRRLDCPADADLPRIRGAGLAAARGEWVALTEDCCVAAPDWLAQLASRVSPECDVVGGSVGIAAGAPALDWGAYFAEFGFFGALRERRSGVPLVTGANVVYRRSIALEVASWMAAGDWENVVHDRLHARGARFLLADAAQVRDHLTHRLAPFLRDRYVHGRDYARTRAGGIGSGARWLRALSAPVLPLLLAGRIWRRSGRRTPAAFVRALPFTAAFLAAWSLGEAVGYALAPARR